ncbi:MAG: exodeoxyribonuclease VII small subunit [bacterium]|nr:exodeoxyribonuclease VII small subunit [bacterium]MDO5462862.1 exodeoxyribonuclease VII small subunit [bacterium]
MAAEKKTPVTFEEASARLDELVRQMESGQLALDKMIEAFEEGRRLVAYCNAKLTEVAQRVEQIKEDEKTGAIMREPFDK